MLPIDGTDSPTKLEPLPKVWSKIWGLQADLNRLVGVDTEKMGIDREKYSYLEWTDRYCDEAMNELFEAKENFYHKWWVKEVKSGKVTHYQIKDRAKVILELIDTIHFVVSAIQTTTEKSAWKIPELGDLVAKIGREAPLSDQNIYFKINTIITLLSYRETSPALSHIRSILYTLGVNDDAILDVYKKKHAANVARQNNGYSEATKTEDDNRQIEKDIK